MAEKPDNVPSSYVQRSYKPNRIRELRKRGVVLSQTDLGRLAGVSYPTVNRNENGYGLTPELVAAYAKVLRVPSYELFIDPEELPNAEETVFPQPVDDEAAESIA